MTVSQSTSFRHRVDTTKANPFVIVTMLAGLMLGSITATTSTHANDSYPGMPDGWHPPMSTFEPREPFVPDFIEKKVWEDNVRCMASNAC